MEEKRSMRDDSSRRVAMCRPLGSGCGMWSPILPPESAPRETIHPRSTTPGVATTRVIDLSSSPKKLVQPEVSDSL